MTPNITPIAKLWLKLKQKENQSDALQIVAFYKYFCFNLIRGD